MKQFLVNQWIALVATIVAIGSMGFAVSATTQSVTTVEAVRILCEDGATGATGSAGVDGQDGAQGPQGEPGADGQDGAQGLQGEIGPCGPQGEIGPQGPAGPQGEVGPQGPQGATGPQGPQGATGPAGATGAQGERGAQGPAGAPGATGLQGLTGPQGPAGPAAEEIDFVVQGGTIGGTQPTFSSDPLFFGSSVRNGDLVYFRINVDFDNITSFGTGQYFVSLPYPSKYDATVRGGHLERFSNGRRYPIAGHLEEGSDVMTLWYQAGTGQDEEFDFNSPFTLTADDEFHVSGEYLAISE